MNNSAPTMIASTVVSHVEKMKVSPTLNGRCVSGSILTKVARIHDNRTPMTGIEATIATLDRRDVALIHSLRSAAGPAARSSRRDRSVTRRAGDGADDVPWSMADVVLMVMVMGSFFGSRYRSDGCEFGDGAGHVEEDLLERS